MANKNDVEILSSIVSALQGLPTEDQKRIIETVITFLGISIDKSKTHGAGHIQHSVPVISNKNEISFSEDRSMSPKDFMREKAPTTDVERIACLAYYLTHYRDTPHFKTVDLSTLNTEAAQPKFANPSFSVINATNMGYLVQASKGMKQISAGGELFVQNLPDREAAKASMSNLRPKGRSKKKGAKRSKK